MLYKLVDKSTDARISPFITEGQHSELSTKMREKYKPQHELQSKPITLERGQCGICKHWHKYSDDSMKCSFYGSMPRTSIAEKYCDIDNTISFGFEIKETSELTSQ